MRIPHKVAEVGKQEPDHKKILRTGDPLLKTVVIHERVFKKSSLSTLYKCSRGEGDSERSRGKVSRRPIIKGTSKVFFPSWIIIYKGIKAIQQIKAIKIQDVAIQMKHRWRITFSDYINK